MPHKAFEHGKFDLGKFNGASVSPTCPGNGVELDVVGFEDAWLKSGEAALECAYAGFQFVHRAGLGHVVVRSNVESGDSFRNRAEGADNDDVGLYSGIAGSADDLLAFHPGEHKVDNGEVIGIIKKLMIAFQPVGNCLARISDS